MELLTQRGAVPIALDRPRILFFDLAAFDLLVRAYGLDFVAALYTVKANQVSLTSVDALAYFLWAGLQAECNRASQTLTLEQAAELLRPFNLRPVFNAVLVAFTTALSAPPPPGDGSGKGEAARPAAKRPATKKPKKTVGRKVAGASTSTTRSDSRSRP